MNSIWTENIDMPQFPQLEGDIRTQVLIVGGGMSGILCAYFLQQAGVDYCLLEKNRICEGITAHTTAKITSQQGAVYDKLLRKKGIETAAFFLRANEQAKKYYREIAAAFDCDMEEKDAYVYARTDRALIEREAAALKKLGYPAEFVEQTRLPFETAGALKVENQLQFHPLKFVSAIAKNLNIYEHSEVEVLEEYLALTEKGSVAAQKVIIATHFPMSVRMPHRKDSLLRAKLRGGYYLKLYQERAYVLALKNAPDVDGMYVDAIHGGLSFRNYGELLLVGGASHRTGKKAFDAAGASDGGKKIVCGMQTLKNEVQELFPQSEIVAEWAAQDCMSLDRLPCIGRYSRNLPDVFVGTGFNKWGMTGAMISAMVLSDLVQERENEFADIFLPGRKTLNWQLAKNMGSAAKNILKPYRGTRCSHMGCVLQWNEEEKTWECPCHGSRYNGEGEILDNPAAEKIALNRK